MEVGRGVWRWGGVSVSQAQERSDLLKYEACGAFHCRLPVTFQGILDRHTFSSNLSSGQGEKTEKRLVSSTVCMGLPCEFTTDFLPDGNISDGVGYPIWKDGASDSGPLFY